MDSKTSTFRSHLYNKVWQYILLHDKLNASMEFEEDPRYDPEEFYATAIPDLFKSLSDNYEISYHFKSVVMTLPIDERLIIQEFMAWYEIHQDKSFMDIYSAISYDGTFDTRPLQRLIDLTQKVIVDPPKVEKDDLNEGLQFIFKVIDQFTSAAFSLLHRRLGKTCLKLKDEYDMQDLLFVMLKANFPYLSTEEVVKGQSDRKFLKIDFLVPEHKVGIECKFYRGEELKTITNQIDIDIQSYHKHQDCDNLVFFIYNNHPQKKIDAWNLEKSYRRTQSFDGKEMNIFLKIRPKN